MVVFVCSPLASATNGAALRVDGGVVGRATGRDERKGAPAGAHRIGQEVDLEGSLSEKPRDDVRLLADLAPQRHAWPLIACRR